MFERGFILYFIQNTCVRVYVYMCRLVSSPAQFKRVSPALSHFNDTESTHS